MGEEEKKKELVRDRVKDEERKTEKYKEILRMRERKRESVCVSICFGFRDG